MQKDKELSIVEMKAEIDTTLGNIETMNALIATSFKGFTPALAKQAVLEGMMRGYTLKDFLTKRIYAIPYSGSYSLVTSIQDARIIGMKSGVVGKSEPIYEDDKNGRPESCMITIKKQIGKTIGDFTAKVYFSEYNTGKQQWASKPRTMISKVAEMHALRMACPEEMGQEFIEEEMGEAGNIKVENTEPTNIQKVEKPVVDSGKIEHLKELLVANGKTVEAFLGHLNREKIEDITEIAIDGWITKLEKELEVKAAPQEAIVVEEMPPVEPKPKAKTPAQQKMDDLIAARKAPKVSPATPVKVLGGMPGDVCQFLLAIENVPEINLDNDILELKLDANRGTFKGVDAYPNLREIAANYGVHIE